MSSQGVDPSLVHAWLSARSIARGLPPPVSQYGGFRVDTASDTEIARWVFPQMGPGLEELGGRIKQPGYLLKLCGTAEALQAALPPGWQLHAPSYFMQADGEPGESGSTEGYRIEVERRDMVVEARIFSDAGVLAASGYAAETREAFVYDRIVTEPEHRRKGLGRAVMSSLRGARRRPGNPELLVATEDGRALYATLGWKTISPYATASFVCAIPGDPSIMSR